MLLAISLGPDKYNMQLFTSEDMGVSWEEKYTSVGVPDATDVVFTELAVRGSQLVAVAGTDSTTILANTGKLFYTSPQDDQDVSDFLQWSRSPRGRLLSNIALDNERLRTIRSNRYGQLVTYGYQHAMFSQAIDPNGVGSRTFAPL